MRCCWLAFERPPHPDAVVYPATSDDVWFVLELLDSPAQHRQRLAEQLRRAQVRQADIAPWQRPAIPCRRASGVYALVSWRLAKWLSVVLPAADGLIERTRAQLEAWLARGTSSAIIQPTRD